MIAVSAANLVKSSSPIDNSTTRRHGVMTLHRIFSNQKQGSRHHARDESHANDRFHGIDELETETDPEPSFGIVPIECPVLARDPASTALQTSLVREHYLFVLEREAFGWANTDTNLVLALCANILIDSDMRFGINNESNRSELVGYGRTAHRDLPARMASLSTFHVDTLPFTIVLARERAEGRGLPSLVNSFARNSEASLGYVE